MLLLYYKKWKGLNSFSFIIITTVLILVLMIPIALVLNILDINDEDIGGIDFENYSFFVFFILTVIIAPIIETFIGQVIPIKIARNLLEKKIFVLLLSAFFFSAMHIGYSIWYGFLVFPMGFILAETFIIFEERRESSFWITASVHSLKNLIAIISIIFN